MKFIGIQQDDLPAVSVDDLCVYLQSVRSTGLTLYRRFWKYLRRSERMVPPVSFNSGALDKHSL